MPEFAYAHLTPLTDNTGAAIDPPDPDKTITVQFNPETLEVTARNQVQEDRGKKQKKPPVQVVTSSEMSLSVQLVFDETLSGDDVRRKTTAIGALMRPGDTTLEGYGEGGADKEAKIPSIVRFEWGSFRFDGTIGEFTETLEYFSDGGVPLRASVKFSMTEQGATYAAQTGGNTADVSGGMDVPEGAALPDGPDRGATQDVAKKNGVEDVKNPGVDTIFSTEKTAGGASIRGAIGAGAGLGAGGGVGAGGSFGLKASAVASGKIGISLSAGAGISVGASAGISAGVSLGGSLGASTGGALSLGAGASASDSLGLGEFAKLSPPKPPKDVVGAARKLGSGSFGASGGGASVSAGFGGAGGGGTKPGAKAEVGASLDLGQVLFGEG
ncbi:MAG: hypothetical protein ABJL99_03440 [Aliishimia sp.]